MELINKGALKAYSFGMNGLFWLLDLNPLQAMGYYGILDGKSAKRAGGQMVHDCIQGRRLTARELVRTGTGQEFRNRRKEYQCLER